MEMQPNNKRKQSIACFYITTHVFLYKNEEKANSENVTSMATEEDNGRAHEISVGTTLENATTSTESKQTSEGGSQIENKPLCGR